MKAALALTTAAAVIATAAGCGSTGPGADADRERQVSCYGANGAFKKFDDDCHDDGLFELKSIPRPKVTKAATTKAPFTQPRPVSTKRR